MVEWGLQHLSGPADEWRCKWREGEVKAFSDTKHTPEALVQNTQLHHIKDTVVLSERPFGMRHIPSIYIFIQTNTWLLVPRWANDKRQMCPPRRIQFDKLPLHKLLNNPKKSQE